MKRTALPAVLVLSFFLISAMKTEETTPLGVNVVIAPSTRDPYMLLERATPTTYTCRAQIYDANDRSYVFNTAAVIVSPGGKQSETVKANGLEMTFTVGVSKEQDKAITQVIAKRGEKTVLNQRSEVELGVAQAGTHFLR